MHNHFLTLTIAPSVLWIIPSVVFCVSPDNFNLRKHLRGKRLSLYCEQSYGVR